MCGSNGYDVDQDRDQVGFRKIQEYNPLDKVKFSRFLRFRNKEFEFVRARFEYLWIASSRGVYHELLAGIPRNF